MSTPPPRRNPIEAVSASDPQTVVFRLRSPYADLPVMLADTNARIIPALSGRGDMSRLDREAIGTGPFNYAA